MTNMFDRKKVEIETRCLDGKRRVFAWVEGHFAIHQEILSNSLFGLEYAITHMPSGIGMGPIFATRESAAGALNEIAALCDWGHFDPKTIDAAFKKRMRDIMLIRLTHTGTRC